MRRFLRHPAREFAQQASGKPPDAQLTRHHEGAVPERHAVLFPINIVHRESRIKDAEFGANNTRDLRWIWVELRRARRNRHHHVDQEVARWDVGGIK